MCTQCGSASFRAFISSSTRVLISEKVYKCTEFEKLFQYITPSVSTAETCLYYKNRDSFHLSLRSHCLSENTFFFFSPAIFQGEDNLAEILKKSTEKRKYFLRPLRRIIANCLLMSVSLRKKWGGVSLNQDFRFYLSWRNWSAMEIPQYLLSTYPDHCYHCSITWPNIRPITFSELHFPLFLLAMSIACGTKDWSPAVEAWSLNHTGPPGKSHALLSVFSYLCGLYLWLQYHDLHLLQPVVLLPISLCSSIFGLPL